MTEGRILGVDTDLSQKRRQQCPVGKQIAEFLLDHIADHPFAFSAEDIERISAVLRPGGGLEGKQADLGAIAMGDDDLMAGADKHGKRRRGLADIGSLRVGCHGLAAL